jgi:hypothetical protein
VTHELSARVTALPRERLRARSRHLPSELVVGVMLLLLAATAATLLVLGILRVAVTGVAEPLGAVPGAEVLGGILRVVLTG